MALLAAAVQHGDGGVLAPSSSAPTPYGPPILCPVTVIAASPDAAKSTSSWPTACTASACSGTPNSRATADEFGDRHDRADLVVGPHHGGERDVVGVALDGLAQGLGVHPAVRVDRQPLDRRALVLGEPLDGVQDGVVLDGAGQDPGPGRFGVRRAQYRPLTARLSASVPPEVKTTSLGRAPSASARVSRASSTVRRARRPAACSEEALPVTASCSVIASTASGSMGVVAAWSR